MTAWPMLLMQVTAWPTLLIALSGILLSAAINLLIVAYYVGKYSERVERLTGEVNRYEDKVEKQYKELAKFGRILAAFTGQANGYTREET